VRPSKRDELVREAQQIFYRDGFHATGMDLLSAETGISKTTMFKHFRSKEELILAALQRRDETFREWFLEEVTKVADTPRARLLALFDVLRRWIGGDAPGPGFSGCTFINAAAEYGDPANPVHRAARTHKHRLRAAIAELAEAAGARNPDALATRLHLLIEGAIVTAQVTGEIGAVDHAKDIARTVIAGDLDAG